MVLKTRDAASESFDDEGLPVTADWPPSKWTSRTIDAPSRSGGPGSLRVALFTDYYPPHLGGGVEQVVSNLASGLARRGHDVRVFTLRTCGGSEYELQDDGVRVYRANALQLTKLLRMQSSFSRELHDMARDALADEPADVLHAHNRFFFSSLVAAHLSVKTQTPLVTTLHLGSLSDLPPAMRLPSMAYERTLGRYVVNRSERLIAVSKAVASYAPHYGASPDKITVVPNAVDSVSFHPDLKIEQRWDGRLRVGFVGRLIANKGPQYLLEAAPALLTTHPRAEIVMVGDGPMRPTLEARAEALGIRDKVSFLGNRKDVADVLRSCDIFVRPSLMEGMPLTVLEAMACGVPVVATPVGGTPEVVQDEHTGLLVPPGNIGELSIALVRLAQQPLLRERLGEAGRRLVCSDFTWDGVTERNLEVYKQALGVETAVEVPLALPQAA